MLSPHSFGCKRIKMITLITLYKFIAIYAFRFSACIPVGLFNLQILGLLQIWPAPCILSISVVFGVPLFFLFLDDCSNTKNWFSCIPLMTVVSIFIFDTLVLIAMFFFPVVTYCMIEIIALYLIKCFSYLHRKSETTIKAVTVATKRSFFTTNLICSLILYTYF